MRKYLIIALACVILIIPMFFGIYLEYFLIREFTLFVIFNFILGLVILLLINKLIVVYGYDPQSFEAIKKQDVIHAMISKNHKEIIWIFLPMIILLEELIFRYYMIGLLLNQGGLNILSAIFISSIAFSLYHIHIWFRFKNLRILLIYLGNSFLLGLFNGYILLTLGLIPCVLIHFTLVLIMYYNVYTRYFEGNINSS
ncbi:MAG: type II CAAX prenyl endopeptidase Rce1 family protein [Promethearchaeota archaeon]